MYPMDQPRITAGTPASILAGVPDRGLGRFTRYGVAVARLFRMCVRVGRFSKPIACSGSRVEKTFRRRGPLRMVVTSLAANADAFPRGGDLRME